MTVWDWIEGNKLFSGAGVVLVTAACRWLQKRYGKKPEPEKAMLVSTPVEQQNASLEGEHTPPTAHTISYKEIVDHIDSLPPLQRQDVEKHYVGVTVDWETTFRGARKYSDGLVSLSLNACEIGHWVRCVVPLEQYPELGVMREGARVRVTGKIKELDVTAIVLENAYLRFLG
jgi:hypothetical protein